MTEATGWVSIISSVALVTLTGGLVYFTRALWQSTQRLAEATDAMAAATVRGSELEHGSRLATEWKVIAREKVCLQVRDRRRVPILLDAAYMGTSQDLTTRKTRQGAWPAIRLRRVPKWLCTINRSAEQPLRMEVPIETAKIADSSISVVVQIEIHYRDFGSREKRLLSASCFCRVDNETRAMMIVNPSESHDRFDDVHWKEDDDEFPAEKEGDFVGRSGKLPR